jgi:hypothetical protein
MKTLSPVIASEREATQLMQPKKAGLLRRLAPRKDDEDHNQPT